MFQYHFQCAQELQQTRDGGGPPGLRSRKGSGSGRRGTTMVPNVGLSPFNERNDMVGCLALLRGLFLTQTGIGSILGPDLLL